MRLRHVRDPDFHDAFMLHHPHLLHDQPSNDDYTGAHTWRQRYVDRLLPRSNDVCRRSDSMWRGKQALRRVRLPHLPSPLRFPFHLYSPLIDLNFTLTYIGLAATTCARKKASSPPPHAPSPSRQNPRLRLHLREIRRETTQ
jgi:hypothetical protein